MKRTVLKRAKGALGEGGLYLLAAKALGRASEQMLIRGATNIMRRRPPTPLADEVDFAFEFRYGDLSIAPAQVRSELERLLELLATEKPRTILKIGSARGGTLYLSTRVAAPDGLLVAVDLADSDHTEFAGGTTGLGRVSTRRLLSPSSVSNSSQPIRMMIQRFSEHEASLPAVRSTISSSTRPSIPRSEERLRDVFAAGSERRPDRLSRHRRRSSGRRGGSPGLLARDKVLRGDQDCRLSRAGRIRTRASPRPLDRVLRIPTHTRHARAIGVHGGNRRSVI